MAPLPRSSLSLYPPQLIDSVPQSIVECEVSLSGEVLTGSLSQEPYKYDVALLHIDTSK